MSCHCPGKRPIVVKLCSDKSSSQKLKNDVTSTAFKQNKTPSVEFLVSRISLVKPEKARQIEDMILAQASGGRLPGKVLSLKMCDALSHSLVL